jgi:hypothetical protein
MTPEQMGTLREWVRSEISYAMEKLQDDQSECPLPSDYASRAEKHSNQLFMKVTKQLCG